MRLSCFTVLRISVYHILVSGSKPDTWMTHPLGECTDKLATHLKRRRDPASALNSCFEFISEFYVLNFMFWTYIEFHFMNFIYELRFELHFYELHYLNFKIWMLCSESQVLNSCSESSRHVLPSPVAHILSSLIERTRTWRKTGCPGYFVNSLSLARRKNHLPPFLI